MKYVLFYLICLFLLSCQQDSTIEPSAYLNEREQFEFKYEVSRYVEQLPKKASESTKFDTEFDEEYSKRSENADLLFYYVDKKTGEIYFAIAKIAPSLTVKKVVTAGKLKKDAKGSITDYEEEFRTWKMEVADIRTVSEMLFKKYIQGEDLSPFYTRNANGKFIIEFPDENVSYDKEKRIWVSKLNDPLKDYYRLKSTTPVSDKK